MTSAQSNGEILRTDTLARVRTPPQRKLELLEEFERSGLSGSNFAAWVAKRQRSRPGDNALAKPVESAAKVRWLEAVVDRAQEAAGKTPGVLTVHFAGGARAEVGTPQQAQLAAALLRALEPRC
jgi:hypothetical protein